MREDHRTKLNWKGREKSKYDKKYVSSADCSESSSQARWRWCDLERNQRVVHLTQILQMITGRKDSDHGS